MRLRKILEFPEAKKMWNNYYSKSCLFSLVMVIGAAMNSSSCAQITITQRQSVASFDVLAGVGPALDRELDNPPIFTAPTGNFELANEYTAFVVFDNGTIAGAANAYGIMGHANSVAQTSADSLAVEFINISNGMIETKGAGGASSKTRASLLLRFTVAEETQYMYSFNNDPVVGGSEASILFNSTTMPLVLIDADAAGDVASSGVLPPGEYRISIFTTGLASSANGKPQNDPPYDYGLNFSLRLGDVLPGDLNLDGVVNLLDVQQFIATIFSGGFQFEGDLNGDGVVNLLDISAFIAALSGE